MRRRLACIGLVLCCSAFCANAAPPSPAVTARVIAIKPDQSLVLETVGPVAFGNLIYPDAALAQAWLAETLLQQNITLTLRDEDRYGRRMIESDRAVAMLRDGAAMGYAASRMPPEWKAAEAAARAARRGIWADKDRVITPENAAQHIGQFRLVEGTITRIYEAKNATYINFGADWKSDFSITIPAKMLRSMKATLATLTAGKRVAVRGMIIEENGPMVVLGHADNLSF